MKIHTITKNVFVFVFKRYACIYKQRDARSCEYLTDTDARTVSVVFFTVRSFIIMNEVVFQPCYFLVVVVGFAAAAVQLHFGCGRVVVVVFVTIRYFLYLINCLEMYSSDTCNNCCWTGALPLASLML